MMRRRRFLFATAASVFAASCTSAPQPAATFPPLLQRAAPTVRTAYLFAATHERELRYIPCFCGCGSDGHTSNYDCFVKARAHDGTVTYDPHGAACGTCLAVALDVKTMLEAGMPLRQIRATIDQRWSGGGSATSTPLPP